MRDRIADDMRAAMKARETVRTSTLRMLMTAVKNAEVEKRRELSDDEVVEVIGREAKRRRESIEAFGAGGRQDLVDKETAELAVLDGYLPERLSDEELTGLVDAAIADAGAAGPQDVGAVMKVLMPKVKGRADGGAVSAAVKRRLGG